MGQKGHIRGHVEKDTSSRGNARWVRGALRLKMSQWTEDAAKVRRGKVLREADETGVHWACPGSWKKEQRDAEVVKRLMHETPWRQERHADSVQVPWPQHANRALCTEAGPLVPHGQHVSTTRATGATVTCGARASKIQIQTNEKIITESDSKRKGPPDLRCMVKNHGSEQEHR